MTPTVRKIQSLDARIGKLRTERDALLIQRGSEEGFKPCDDCLQGFCTMNCSSAPGYLKMFV